MSTPNTVISQLQSDLQRTNDTTGLSDTTIHDAISSLILGYGTGTGAVPQTRKFQGEITPTASQSIINHNCNKTRYLFIINAEGSLEDTGGAWYVKSVIGFYDENGINFNNATYNTVSAAHRIKDGTGATIVLSGNNSTNNKIGYSGNSMPIGVKCTWELYDLSDI